jgi:activator of HSP90 ATPase
MNTNSFNRRDFSVRMAAFLSGAGLSGFAMPLTGNARVAAQMSGAASGEEISHSAESIHQEVTFNASRKRVYETLIDAAQFDKVVKLSMAVQSGMLRGSNKPTEISREVGGAFILFGGYITGRQIDLAPGEDIIQAWRSASWDPGLYSIASFELKEQGSDTKLVFNHRGYPDGASASLLEGWNGNYWEPMKKVLGK